MLNIQKYTEKIFKLQCTDNKSRNFINFNMTFEVYKEKYHTIYFLESITVPYFFYSWLQTNRNYQDISKFSEPEAWNASYEFLIFLLRDRTSSVLLSMYMPYIRINVCMLHQFFLSCRLFSIFTIVPISFLHRSNFLQLRVL